MFGFPYPPRCSYVGKRKCRRGATVVMRPCAFAAITPGTVSRVESTPRADARFFIHHAYGASFWISTSVCRSANSEADTIMKRSLLVFVLCAYALGVQAEVYKWIDADGKTQYGDAPPKNAKAKVVSGGVTVVPAMVVPQSAPASQSNPEGSANNERTRSGSIGRKPDGKSDSPVPASAPADPAATARDDARMRAIERCKSNRGVDCESEVDAQLNGQPTAGNTYVIPGWSDPPIRPTHPPLSRSSAHKPTPVPQPPSVKAAASAPVSERESRPGGVIKPMR
ncbi:MAG: hypothetical protein JWN23_3276 [Rhodocyclales bacterium]|nr:hypothetical protein [Rhodocyclales bacterium]